MNKSIHIYFGHQFEFPLFFQIHGAVEVNQVQMVVEEHLQIHVDVDSNKIMSFWVDLDKVSSTQHALRVVDDEQAKDDDSIVRMDDDEETSLGEQRHRDHAPEKCHCQHVVQNLPTDRVVNVGLKCVER